MILLTFWVGMFVVGWNFENYLLRFRALECVCWDLVIVVRMRLMLGLVELFECGIF